MFMEVNVVNVELKWWILLFRLPRGISRACRGSQRANLQRQSLLYSGVRPSSQCQVGVASELRMIIQLLISVNTKTNNPRWYRRSLLLESDNNFLIESRGTLHTFIIRKVESQHFGNYRCLASNSLGRESAEIQLTGETEITSIPQLKLLKLYCQGYPRLQFSRAPSWAPWVTVTDWPGWLSLTPTSWSTGWATGKLW